MSPGWRKPDNLDTAHRISHLLHPGAPGLPQMEIKFRTSENQKTHHFLVVIWLIFHMFENFRRLPYFGGCSENISPIHWSPRKLRRREDALLKSNRRRFAHVIWFRIRVRWTSWLWFAECQVFLSGMSTISHQVYITSTQRLTHVTKITHFNYYKFIGPYSFSCHYIETIATNALFNPLFHRFHCFIVIPPPCPIGHSVQCSIESNASTSPMLHRV